jgi:hypothetical protein
MNTIYLHTFILKKTGKRWRLPLLAGAGMKDVPGT